MQVSVSRSGKLGRKMKVEVPVSDIMVSEEKRLKKLGKSVKIDGFRKGKVPMKVIKERYGPQVHQEVLGDLIQSSLVDALAQEKLNPAGMPNIEDTKFEQGQPLTYTAVFEVYPEVKLKPFAKIKVKKTVATVTDADINKTLEVIRGQYKDWHAVERAAKDGDQVDINFVGTVDGTEFAGGKAENFKLELGAGNMIPGFAEGIVALKADDEKTIDVTFPESYGEKTLAGKEAQFAITVNEVAEAKLPEVNEEFAKRLGIKEGGIDTLKTEVQKNMQRELDQALKAKTKKQVMDALFAENKIELPQAVVDTEIKRLQKQAEKMYGQQATADEVKIKSKELFVKEAERRVALGLFIAEIVQEKKIKVDTSRVRKMVEEIADAYEKPAEVVSMYYTDKQRLAGIESLVLEEQVVDDILEEAKVTEAESSFDDIIKPEQR